MKRGDIVTAVSSGDFGKPRPALIVQSDWLDLMTVVICPFTSDLIGATPIRVSVEPTERNGLRRQSHIMIDKVTTVQRTRCGGVIGELDEQYLAAVEEKLALLFGLGD